MDKSPIEDLNRMFKPIQKQKPFDMGIKGFKRLLEQNTNLSKGDKHRAVVAYKARIAERLQSIHQNGDKIIDDNQELSKKGVDNGPEV